MSSLLSVDGSIERLVIKELRLVDGRRLIEVDDTAAACLVSILIQALQSGDCLILRELVLKRPLMVLVLLLMGRLVIRNRCNRQRWRSLMSWLCK